MIVPAEGSVGVSMDPHLTEIERRPDRGVLLTAYTSRLTPRLTRSLPAPRLMQNTLMKNQD
jgi:hypothetical protein